MFLIYNIAPRGIPDHFISPIQSLLWWTGVEGRDSLKRPHYLSRVDHVHKIRTRKQRKDIGKYSFVNRTIGDWNQLPAEVLEVSPANQPLLEKD
jgi:hypothetical protein